MRIHCICVCTDGCILNSLNCSGGTENSRKKCIYQNSTELNLCVLHWLSQYEIRQIAVFSEAKNAEVVSSKSHSPVIAL